jgi:pimeloyl-ACP methyl ester carboxylesterase
MATAINRSAADAHGSGVSAATHYRTATVDGLNIFYREAGPKDAPVVLLLHGFPSSSHMFRNLIPQLADAYHVIAPDYPAFGHSDTPDRAQFTYSFDHIAEIIDDLLDALGVRRLALYMMDIGAAIGFRLAVKHPDAVWAIVAQNGPLFDEDGGEEFFATMAGFWQDGSDDHRNAIRGFLTPESTRAQYIAGVADPSLVDPDSWLVDQALLDRPGVDEIMLDYLFEVRNRPSTIDGVLEFLRSHQPPTLIATGANDPLFPEANMRHYLDALPDAEFHALDTGHFALEDKGDEIAALMRDFLERHETAAL